MMTNAEAFSGSSPKQVARVIDLLSAHAFSFVNETELQDGIAQLLSAARIPFNREVRLSETDRADFLIEDIAVEVKTDCSLSELTRQLHRYAQIESINALILVTCKSRHRELPDTLNGKRLHIVVTEGI